MDQITQPRDGLNKLKEKVKTATGSQLKELWFALGTFLVAVQEDTNAKLVNSIYLPEKNALKDKLLVGTSLSEYNMYFDPNTLGRELNIVKLNAIVEAMRTVLLGAISHLERTVQVSQNTDLIDLLSDHYSYRIFREEAPSFAQRGNMLSQITADNVAQLNHAWLTNAIYFLRDLLLSGAIELEHKDSVTAVKAAFKLKLEEITNIQNSFTRPVFVSLMNIADQRNLYSKLLEIQFADGKNIFEKFAIWGEKYKVPAVVENAAPGAANI